MCPGTRLINHPIAQATARRGDERASERAAGVCVCARQSVSEKREAGGRLEERAVRFSLAKPLLI